MSAVAADTHTLVWYLTRSPKLSPAALSALEAAAANGDPVWVPSICLVELTYLTERSRLPLSALVSLRQELDNPSSAMEIAPLNLAVVDALASVPRSSVPDMPDRIIAATAVSLGLPLITRDAQIRSLSIATIW